MVQTCLSGAEGFPHESEFGQENFAHPSRLRRDKEDEADGYDRTARAKELAADKRALSAR